MKKKNSELFNIFDLRVFVQNNVKQHDLKNHIQIFVFEMRHVRKFVSYDVKRENNFDQRRLCHKHLKLSIKILLFWRKKKLFFATKCHN